MKLTIIETGRVPDAIRNDFPNYPQMFEALISPHASHVSFDTIAVEQGEALPDIGTLDAILITGSAAGVYEDHPWIDPLFEFIRNAAEAHVPQVGICFGHQAMAQALGGEVVKSDKGWGLGRHTYNITAADWMSGSEQKELTIPVSHQDQVVTPPPDAQTIAQSKFTPFAGLSYAQGPAISFQCHPEFSNDFSTALYRSRLGRPLTDAQVSEAIDSLARPDDNAVLGQWIAKFICER